MSDSDVAAMESYMSQPQQDPVEIKAVDNPDWQSIAEALWMLLDNIDTASDQFKTNYKALADFTYKEQQKRHKLMTSDGHNLCPLRSTPVDGTCCSCQYDGKEETKCTGRDDNIHCNHWWDGTDEDNPSK